MINDDNAGVCTGQVAAARNNTGAGRELADEIRQQEGSAGGSLGRARAVRTTTAPRTTILTASRTPRRSDNVEVDQGLDTGAAGFHGRSGRGRRDALRRDAEATEKTIALDKENKEAIAKVKKGRAERWWW